MIRIICIVLALSQGMIPGYAEEPIPLEVFLAPPEFHTPKLSPDGRYFGVVGVRLNTEFLATIEFATGKSAPVTSFTGLKLVDYWWKSSDLILMLVENNLGERDFRSFDLKTKRTNSLEAFNLKGGFMVNPLANDPDNVLVSSYAGNEVDLRRLNLRTAKSVVVQKHADSVERWLTNKEGKALAGFGRLGQRWFMIFAAKNAATWRRVELGDKNLPDFAPITVANDQTRILGYNYTATDTLRVVLWNPVDDTKETVWHSPEVDPDRNLVWGDDETQTRAIVYETDRPRFHYLREEDRTLAQEIDAALPGTINLIVSTNQDESKMIIKAFSDTLPDDYYLLDKKAGRISKLGTAHSRIDPNRMASSRYFAYKSRDGLLLHGRIYLPHGSKGPCPAILYTGSGLTNRTNFLFQPYLQLLASRGYATVEIDHRGIQGYGLKYAEAGNLGLAGTMIDDLVDGLRWLAQEGLIDRKRVAIMGQEQSGLLAIHALARYPEDFTAWINLSTPMDSGYLDFSQVVFGRYSEKETLSRVGGESAGRKYLRTLDPVPLLPKIRVPSFHYYPRNQKDNSLLYEGSRVEKHFAKSELPHVFLRGQAIDNFSEFFANRSQKEYAEFSRIYTELLAFMDKHLAAHP